MNAEIVATLEEKYPEPSLDMYLLAAFLDSLASAPQGGPKESYIDFVNDKLSRTDAPYTARTSGDGVITFYPYATTMSDALVDRTNRRKDDDE